MATRLPSVCIFMCFVGTEPKLSNPVFLLFTGFGFSWNRCFLILFVAFCIFFFYIRVLFPERIEEFRTTGVTSEPPRIEGLLTALANVPGVPPFPLV